MLMSNYSNKMWISYSLIRSVINCLMHKTEQIKSCLRSSILGTSMLSVLPHNLTYTTINFSFFMEEKTEFRYTTGIFILLSFNNRFNFQGSKKYKADCSSRKIEFRHATMYIKLLTHHFNTSYYFNIFIILVAA